VSISRTSRRICAPAAASPAPSRSCSPSRDFRCARTSLSAPSSAALAHADAVARTVGLSDALGQEAASLTVAGRKRLELARALATGPRLLLLDEVLAGLNPSEIRDLIPVIRGIRDGGVTIFMVEHVLQAVMSLCEHVHVLAEGRLIAAGPPRAVCDDPRVVEAYLGPGAAGRLRAEAAADA
jgi:branched-chain amino acid transport system ATP-binding protein